MTNRELFEEIGNICEEYIAEAQNYQGSKTRGVYRLKSPVLRNALATAACLLICAGLVFTVQKFGITKDAALESAVEGTMNMEMQKESEKMQEAVGSQMEEKKDAPTQEKTEDGLVEELAENKSVAKEEVQNNAEAKLGSIEDAYAIEKECLQWDVAAAKKKMAAYPDTYEDILKLEGVLILMHGSVEKGFEAWEDFLKAVAAKDTSEVEIVCFTVEGDPVIETVYYDGNTFHLCVDHSRDAFRGSNSSYFEAEFSKLEKKETKLDNGGKTIEYWLTDGNNKYRIAYISE